MLRRLLERWRRPATPLAVRLYTRADCPLCTEMKAELTRARTGTPYELIEVDIAGDPELLERHGLSIPVLEIAGRVAFKARLTARDFERKLAKRAAELGAGESTRGRGDEGVKGG